MRVFISIESSGKTYPVMDFMTLRSNWILLKVGLVSVSAKWYGLEHLKVNWKILCSGPKIRAERKSSFWFLTLQTIYSFYGNTNRRHLPVRTNPLSSLLFFHWPIHKSAMKWWSWPSWLNKWKAHFYCEKSIANKNFHHAVLLLAQNYLLIIETPKQLSILSSSFLFVTRIHCSPFVPTRKRYLNLISFSSFVSSLAALT